MCPSPLRSWLKVVSSDSSAVLVPDHSRNEIRQVVAVAVGAPHSVQTGARVVPRNIVTAARNLDRSDRRPCTELTNGYCCAIIFQFGTGAAVVEIEKIVSDLRQGGRSVGLDHHLGNSNGAIAVEVLVEGCLQRLQRDAISRYGWDQIRQVVAVAVGAPRRVQT